MFSGGEIMDVDVKNALNEHVIFKRFNLPPSAQRKERGCDLKKMLGIDKIMEHAAKRERRRQEIEALLKAGIM